jgi:hypothetical protein
MKNIYRIMLLSCVVVATSSFAMEPETKAISKFLSFPGVCAGAFIDNGTLVMSREHQGMVMWNFKLGGVERQISPVVYKQFAFLPNNIVAGVCHDFHIVYSSESNRKCETRLQIGNRAIAFDDTGRIFMHTKGYFRSGLVSDPTSEYCRDIGHDGKTLEELDRKTGEWKKYNIACYSNSSIPAMAFRHVHDEIVYASGDKTLSGITIDENGKVEEKWSVTVDSVKNHLIAGQMKCNGNGSCVAFCNTTGKPSHTTGEPRGDTVFHIYDFVRKITHECGHCNGAAFYSQNHSVIALLRPDTVLEYWNVMMEERIHYSDPIIANQELPGNCCFTMEFSPDGDNLFVVLLAGKPDSEAQDIAFLIPVPACVAAYKRMQEASK